MNSDVENATLTGERVLREYAADSDDRDFQRAYYDNPRLREALNRAALDAAYHDLSEPPSEDEPAVRPRDPMASAYGVGDFVWYEGREYKITDLQRGYVELLPPELPIPVYRTESRADFERGLRFDERNRYITDYLTAELNDDAHEYVWSVLTPEDRAQISAWLRAGEGNTQVAERIAERLSGRNGAETDGLHYRIPDDAGNIVVTGFVPWEQLAGAVRGMSKTGFATIETNKYGLSPMLAGEKVQAKIFYDHVEFYHDHRPVGRFPRSYKTNDEVYDWTKYVSTLCKKPGAIEHTRFFHQMPQRWQDYLASTKGKERKSALQLLSEIVADGNSEFCDDALEMAAANGRADVDSLRQCYYMIAKKEYRPDPLKLSGAPLLNYNPNLSAYDGLMGGEAHG